jgi:hypothetical protein
MTAGTLATGCFEIGLCRWWDKLSAGNIFFCSHFLHILFLLMKLREAEDSWQTLRNFFSLPGFQICTESHLF